MMLEPQATFHPFQFVQEIAFKNKDSHRHDLGIERFGFILSHQVVARTHCDYRVEFSKESTYPLPLDYSLRPLTQDEILERLSYISLHQEEFIPFIIKLNDCVSLKDYHIQEDNCVKAYRANLST